MTTKAARKCRIWTMRMTSPTTTSTTGEAVPANGNEVFSFNIFSSISLVADPLRRHRQFSPRLVQVTYAVSQYNFPPPSHFTPRSIPVSFGVRGLHLFVLMFLAHSSISTDTAVGGT